jgi:hypothetical protein
MGKIGHEAKFELAALFKTFRVLACISDGYLRLTTTHTQVLSITVGAQSIARAQSIAPRHTTYVITAKKLQFREFLFGKIKKE